MLADLVAASDFLSKPRRLHVESWRTALGLKAEC